jgi:hypothetical protein
VVKAVAIDFEDDGTWDERQLFDQSSVTAAFTHTYEAPEAFTVALKSWTRRPGGYEVLVVIVSAPESPQVFYKLSDEALPAAQCTRRDHRHV